MVEDNSSIRKLNVKIVLHLKFLTRVVYLALNLYVVRTNKEMKKGNVCASNISETMVASACRITVESLNAIMSKEDAHSVKILNSVLVIAAMSKDLFSIKIVM